MTSGISIAVLISLALLVIAGITPKPVAAYPAVLGLSLLTLAVAAAVMNALFTG